MTREYAMKSDAMDTEALASAVLGLANVVFKTPKLDATLSVDLYGTTWHVRVVWNSYRPLEPQYAEVLQEHQRFIRLLYR